MITSDLAQVTPEGIMRSATQADITAAEEELIRLGREALGRIKQTFEAWLEVGRALNVGRRYAMAEAQTDSTDDRGYRKAFGRWLQAHPPFDDKRVLPEATRSWLLRCYDHEAEILAWRRDKPEELVRNHYPERVFKRWASVCRPELLTERQRQTAGENGKARPSEERKKQSQAAAIDDAVQRLDHATDQLQGLAAGTQLTLDLSSPEMIRESASMIVDIYGAAYGDEAVFALAAQLLQGRLGETPREKLAAMMLRRSIPTGHGDTFDDLLTELEGWLTPAETKPAHNERKQPAPPLFSEEQLEKALAAPATPPIADAGAEKPDRLGKLVQIGGLTYSVMPDGVRVRKQNHRGTVWWQIVKDRRRIAKVTKAAAALN